ncbi:DNRLRE domain-containing protein [Salinispora arenicola]|uniref:DNRLRE domain-containing protein n=1 Tax=Salinispora arenicola TaxID=168697 RepID=UPI001691B33A|nr:DNRLRE domain-containing protein [Salinispora arenicola]MCN0179071.1 DNRLRE domain-containing protein [Salinispora arenicola]NIL56171.1 VCBS repeat-containing protein [Salinispora arenicola]NIL62199.1 VCBS repeat-containing protein [Salinispora arenicola]
MTAPRLISPFVRTRTRLALTLGLMLTAVVTALLPWWPTADEPPKGVVSIAAAPLKDEAAAMAKALSTGKEVLVETATSATSLTWALPNGQLRSTFHATPQRTKSTAGRWRPVDTTLTRTDTTPDGLGIRPVNAVSPVRFSAGTRASDQADGSGEGQAPVGDGETVLAEADVDGHTIAFTWPGHLPEPVLDGPRALYPDVLPGVDLLVVARDVGGFGQLLIVKNRAAETIKAAGAVTYGLRSETAVFRHNATTGGIQVLDRTGQEVGSVPTPFAWDSAGRVDPDTRIRTAVDTPADVLELTGLAGSEPGARNAQIPTRVDGDGTGALHLHLDAAATGLLSDPDTLFPVFLDPTLNSGVVDWATVYSQYPTTNTWNGTNFNSGTTDARVGYISSVPLRTRSFWRMGFSSSLRGATVSSATFKVLNNHSYNCERREMQLWLVGSISSGTTWNAQPSYMALQQKLAFAHGYGSSCADEYVSFNVKNAAQRGADGGWSSFNLGMRATSESDTKTWRKFKASSASLSVTYNRAPNTPTSLTSSPGGACAPTGVTVAKTDLTLSATATDPDGNLKGLRFRFWKSGSAVPTGTLVTTTSAGKASLTVPSTTLVDEGVYLWNVRAEDTSNAASGWNPPSTPCTLTVDASAPPAPVVDSDVFLEATPDGATWATVKFGQTGPVTFTAAGATRFSYAFEAIGTTYVDATDGTATVPDLKPRHAGPTTLHVYAYDNVGNKSARTDYSFYVPPRDTADGPGDTGGDGIPDLLLVDSTGNLRNYAGDVDGELYAWQAASYTGEGTLNPPGHWYDPETDTAALITKHSDAYPGDGSTDLFARTPDGGFWLYPGDGYGTFNVDDRLRVLLPDNTPDPATWTQIKALGDVTGDGHPDLVLRAGTAFWTLSGYTGASFQEAILMNGNAWARREIVNVADIDLDSTPDLLWRNLDNGNMYIRHGKPGAVTGSVDLDSIKLAANSREGDVSYGVSWTETNVNAVIGIPDVNGNGVPDLWARFGQDGMMRIYHPSTINTHGPVKIVLGDDWNGVKAFG